jgi:hypothetical protein
MEVSKEEEFRSKMTELDEKFAGRLAEIYRRSRSIKDEREEKKRQEMERAMIPKMEKLCEILEKSFSDDETTSVHVSQEYVPVTFVQKLRDAGFTVVSRYDSKGPAYDISI